MIHPPTHAELTAELALPEPPFTLKSIAQLIPQQSRAKHAEAAAKGIVLDDSNSSRRP